MGKKKAKPLAENALSKAVLQEKMDVAKGAFDVLAAELTRRENDFNTYRNTTQQELNRLQGEYRLLNSLMHV